jgi:hypothetical protein
MAKTGAGEEKSASELISERIAELGDWRGEMLRRVRKLIKQAGGRNRDGSSYWKITGY